MYNWSVLPGGPSIPADREEVRTVTLDSGRLAPQAPAQAGLNRIVFLLSLSVLINYIDRSNLSIAAPLLQAELGISNTQLGTLLSAFFWTYALMQIPAGWLVDRFDVKWVFSAGFLLWSTATGVTGVLHGFTALLLIRVILGIGESIAFPSYSKILGRHFKEEHRGFANAVLLAGLALGPAIGMLVGGRVVGRFGWRPFFIALGLIGLLWLVPWLVWMPRRAAAWKPKASLGFLPILRQRSVWGTCLGQASVNYYLYFLVTWLPTYMIRGRHLSMNGMAKDGGLFFLMFAIGSVAWGKLCDRWIKAGSSPTLVRKGSMGFGCAAFGIFVALLALTPDRFFVAMLIPTGLLMGISGCATWAIPQTLAGPEMVGRWTGMQNFIGNLGGAIAPVLTGYLLDRTGEFYWPFFITAGVAWIGAISWSFIVGPIEEVDWSKYSRHDGLDSLPANTQLAPP
jgi:MFS transporter, ACS family, D-galactonate transporter